MSYINFKEVSKIYKTGDVEVKAVDKVSFSVEKGQLAIIVGASGAGKSTILNILGGMDMPTSGEIEVDKARVDLMDENALTDYRRYDIGFVFQFYNLIGNMTAIENVELATQICKDPMLPEEALNLVGLRKRLHSFPAQLSGGEQQRVSIARALAKNPKLLLCDEPTGALDYETGKQVLKVLSDMARGLGVTVVIITHNHALTAMGDVVFHMKSGKIIKREDNPTPTDIADIEW